MLIYDISLILDLIRNSEGTKLLILTVIFCLVFTAPAKWRVELRAKIGHYRNRCFFGGWRYTPKTRGPKGHISCTWVQCATFVATSWFSDRPEKHKLGSRRWDLASYKVSLNSIQRLQSSSRQKSPLLTACH